jgi:hypothetical protein
MLALVLGIAAAAPCEVALDARPVKQRGGRCLAAASATALSARGGTLDPAALARAIPLGRAGEDPFDLQEALKPQGWDTLVFQGSTEQAARLVEAGFSPVMLVDEDGTPHAVAVVGVRRVQAPDGRCVGAAADLAIVDPRVGALRWTPAADLARQQHAERMLVSFEPTAWSALDDAGFPLGAATRADRRYRASSLMARARARPSPDAGSVALLERAVAADPAWSEPRDLLEVHRQALLDPPP